MKTILDRFKELQMMAETEMGRLRQLRVETEAVMKNEHCGDALDDFVVDLDGAIVWMRDVVKSAGEAVKAQEGGR